MIPASDHARALGRLSRRSAVATLIVVLAGCGSADNDTAERVARPVDAGASQSPAEPKLQVASRSGYVKTQTGEEADVIDVVEHYIETINKPGHVTQEDRETLCSLLVDQVKYRESPGVMPSRPCSTISVLGSVPDSLHLEARVACNAGVFPKVPEAWVVYALDDAEPLETDMKFVLSKRNGKWLIKGTMERRGECDDPGYVIE